MNHPWWRLKSRQYQFMIPCSSVWNPSSGERCNILDLKWTKLWPINFIVCIWLAVRAVMRMSPWKRRLHEAIPCPASNPSVYPYHLCELQNTYLSIPMSFSHVHTDAWTPAWKHVRIHIDMHIHTHTHTLTLVIPSSNSSPSCPPCPVPIALPSRCVEPVRD